MGILFPLLSVLLGLVLGLAQPVLAVQGIPAMAPVYPDYLQRSATITTYEQLAREKPSFLGLRLLAGEYLKRFRERMDVEDLRRAETAARRSLSLQDQGNQASRLLLASALLSQHRFREALGEVELAGSSLKTGSLMASIQMELGNYEAAQQLLQDPPRDPSPLGQPGYQAVRAHYLELTGHLDQAQALIEQAMHSLDRFYTVPAETRAWFHGRAGDLAFAQGQAAQAERRYQEALQLYPQAMGSLIGLSKLYAGQQRWREALRVAEQANQGSPLVETLGIQADAQRALGDEKAALATEALIEVVGHLSTVQGIYDRALASYYSDHGIHLEKAVEIAHQELTNRPDILAYDTYAWALAMGGDWAEAERVMQQARRYGTQDARLLFHAGMIAWHLGHQSEAQRALQQALRLNPYFHPQQAALARQTLRSLPRFLS
ncbi:MAG: hypothetical protein NW237_15815 [Cyanobacteriota bacterium]|nr:hypothetical protein [Cyanobacteriota bacterium]